MHVPAHDLLLLADQTVHKRAGRVLAAGLHPLAVPGVEELLNAARFDYALLDFRNPAAHGEWLKEPIVSRPLGNQGMRAVWPNVVDAMFFIRVMEPNLARNPAAPSR